SGTAPVTPSARVDSMVPRRNRPLRLMCSTSEGGFWVLIGFPYASIDVALIAFRGLHRVDVRFGRITGFAADVPHDIHERGVHGRRHVLGLAAHVYMRAALEPVVELLRFLRDPV